MMTEAEIRKAIIGRLKAVNGSCNMHHICHNDGVFRGLIWALTGSDPGSYLTADVPMMLDMAGIPHRSTGDRVEVLPNDRD